MTLEQQEVGWRTIYDHGNRKILMKAVQFDTPLEVSVKTGPASPADITVKLRECHVSPLQDGPAAPTSRGVHYQAQSLPGGADVESSLAHNLQSEVVQAEPRGGFGAIGQPSAQQHSHGLIWIEPKERRLDHGSQQ